jgi:hypothetical protein
MVFAKEISALGFAAMLENLLHETPEKVLKSRSYDVGRLHVRIWEFHDGAKFKIIVEKLEDK